MIAAIAAIIALTAFVYEIDRRAKSNDARIDHELSEQAAAASNNNARIEHQLSEQAAAIAAASRRTERLIRTIDSRQQKAASGRLQICGGEPELSSRIVYTQTFYGDGSARYVDPSCSIVPSDCNVKLNGEEGLPILVNPWERVPINIIGAEIVFLPSGPVTANTYAFAGNSASPDILTWAIPGPTGAAHGQVCFPSGTEMPFPAAAADAPPNKAGQNNFALPHLDVHLSGKLEPFVDETPDPGSYQTYLTVMYTKKSSEADARVR